jgi:FkbM family methyltransferase
MPMVSYAQNGEDVLLNRLFPDGRGFYIDVGAHDPVHLSVTKHFHDRGWRGINLEPEPVAFAKLCEQRPRDINLNVGVSDRDGALTFYEAPGATGWSTFSRAQADHLRVRGLEVIERPVPVVTLAGVCQRHVDRPIDFLKIDAESHEGEVIRGADWRRWRPRVVLIESEQVPPWERSLLAADYLFALFDGINRFYVRAEDPGLLPRLGTMANFLDDYITFDTACLKARLASYDDLSPWAIASARRLQSVCKRVPGLPALLRRISPAA